MIYTLKKPITLAEKTITELNFREEICAGDMRGIAMRDPMQFDDLFKIAGRLSGQTDAVINKLCFADTMEVVKLTASFMQTGPATETTP